MSNFVHHSKLKDYCEQLIPLGLGRINLKAPRSYDKVAAYISKYLSKENQRHRTFGIMRNVPKWEPGCRCKHEDMQDPEKTAPETFTKVIPATAQFIP